MSTSQPTPRPQARPRSAYRVFRTIGTRWMDNDGNLENGHAYITGIYNLWKARTPAEKWSSYALDETASLSLPPLWRSEFTRDVAAARDAAKTAVEKNRAEASKRLSDTIREQGKLEF